jgi:hypothetical protein
MSRGGHFCFLVVLRPASIPTVVANAVRVHSLRSLILALVVSALLIVAIAWRLRQRNQDASQRFRSLAWALRRGDAEQGLSPSQRAYLSGNFLDALRRLERPLSRRDQAAEELYLECLLLDVPWPGQVLQQHQVEVEGERPRLLLRAVQSGYAKESNRVRVEVFGWDGKEFETLQLSGRDATGKPLPALRDWSEVLEIRTVHLERKSAEEAQAWLLGRTRQGSYRAEVFYGLRNWRRWGVVSSQPPRLLSDRVQIPGGGTYKLVDDEWVELR